VKYTLDTNIFIDGFRNEEAQADVFVFLSRALPFTYLSAVVMQELAAGARRLMQRGRAAWNIRTVRTPQRVFAPPAGLSCESGRVLAAIAAREGWHLLDEKRRSLMTH